MFPGWPTAFISTLLNPNSRFVNELISKLIGFDVAPPVRLGIGLGLNKIPKFVISERIIFVNVIWPEFVKVIVRFSPVSVGPLIVRVDAGAVILTFGRLVKVDITGVLVDVAFIVAVVTKLPVPMEGIVKVAVINVGLFVVALIVIGNVFDTTHEPTEVVEPLNTELKVMLFIVLVKLHGELPKPTLKVA